MDKKIFAAVVVSFTVAISKVLCWESRLASKKGKTITKQVQKNKESLIKNPALKMDTFVYNEYNIFFQI